MVGAQQQFERFIHLGRESGLLSGKELQAMGSQAPQCSKERGLERSLENPEREGEHRQNAAIVSTQDNATLLNLAITI